MAKRLEPAVLFLFLLPVGIGTGILGAYTVGASLSPHDPAPLGVGLALLAVALIGWSLFFSEPPRHPDMRFASVLVICGTLCVLVALVLQFYLASVTADNSRRVAEILREKGGNVNFRMDIPDTVKAISYLALFAGIWLAALGIRMAVGRSEPPALREHPAPSAWPVEPATPRVSAGPTDTGFRAG
jgi:hypothetical protein